MSPQNKQLRVVELLPGGERVTSRSLRFVASLDDRGDIAVRAQGPIFVTDLVPLLAAAIAVAATLTGMPRMRCAAGVIMSDLHDRIDQLAAQAQQRADMAGVQATWQEGRAHGLRETAAIAAADADTRTLRDDIRDYIETLEKRIADKEGMLQKLAARSSGYSVGYYEGSRCALFQASEDLRDLLDANEPEEAES